MQTPGGGGDRLYCAVFCDLKFSTIECIAKQSNSMPYNVHCNSFTKASVHNNIQSFCFSNIYSTVKYHNHSFS